MGSGGGVGQLIIASAIIAGLLLTTMPITIIGEAFRRAWDKREVIELQLGCTCRVHADQHHQHQKQGKQKKIMQPRNKLAAQKKRAREMTNR